MTLRTAAIGTALVFTASGSMLGAWVSRLPAVRDHLHATPGQLGIALLAMGIGSVLSMPITGHLCRWFSSRVVVAVMAALACTALALLGHVGTLAQLTVVLFTFGLFYGAWDVSMNVHGSAVDQRAGRAWMPRYHACWSAGSIAGTAFGAMAAEWQWAVSAQFTGNAIVSAVAVGAGLLLFIDERTDGVTTPVHADRRTRKRVVTRELLLIGVVILLSTTVEGAAADWLAIYLADARQATHASAALGFTVFAVTMTIGRFAGTPISERLGRATAVRVGGVIAVAGVLLAVLVPVLWLSYAGAALWGAGICLVFPACVSAAGETSRPAESIAVVTTLGYGALLVGPPMIGTLADHIGLERALLVLVLLAAGMAVFAPAVRERPAPVEVDHTGEARRADVAARD